MKNNENNNTKFIIIFNSIINIFSVDFISPPVSRYSASFQFDINIRGKDQTIIKHKSKFYVDRDSKSNNNILLTVLQEEYFKLQMVLINNTFNEKIFLEESTIRKRFLELKEEYEKSKN